MPKLKTKMLDKFLLDTTILIDQCFGSKPTKRLIDNTLKKSQKYTTYLIFGEFNRTVLETIKNILNILLRNEEEINKFENIDDFINDIIKDMYFFSVQEASRVIKFIPYLKKEIEQKIEKYQKYNLSLIYPILKILDDVNMYRYNLLGNVMLLESSYECQNYLRELSFESNKNQIVFEKPFCTLCERNVLEYFQGNYLSELKLFQKNFNLLTKSFRKDEKKKLIKVLDFILKYFNGIK